MRKLLLLIILALMPATLIAQNTHPVVGIIPIRRGSDDFNPAISRVADLTSLMVLRSDNLQVWAFPIDYGNCVDSVFYDIDSLRLLKEETHIIVRIDSITGYGLATNTSETNSDSLAYVRIRKMDSDTDSSATVCVWRSRANRNIVNNLGFTFNRSNMGVGDQFEIDLTYEKLVKADSLGNVPVNRIYQDYGILIADNDTLGETTQISSSAFGGNVEENTVYINVTSPNANTGTYVGLTYQAKSNFVNSWAGAADTLNQPIISGSFNDSLFSMGRDSVLLSRGRLNAINYNFPFADSLRLIFIRQQGSGRVIIDSVWVHQRK